MKLLAVFVLACGVAMAQRPGTPNPSPTGFGRLSNPSGITPSKAGGGFGRLIYPATGGPPAVGRPGTSTVPMGLPPIQHQPHSRNSLAYYPVIYGGYYSGYDAPPVAGSPGAEGYYDQSYGYEAPQSPVVIINQNFQPEVVNPVIRDYSNAQLPPPSDQAQANQSAAQPVVNNANPQTIYLIAMSDHTIYPAVAYSIIENTLDYTTPQGVTNRVSLGLVDRDFTAQINRERGIDVSIPAPK